MAKAKSKATESPEINTHEVRLTPPPANKGEEILDSMTEKVEKMGKIIDEHNEETTPVPEPPVMMSPDVAVTLDAPEETWLMTALRMLSQLISGIVYYGVERETEQAKLKIEKARGLLYLAVDPDHDFSLEDQYDGGHYEFKTDDNINKALELRESIGEVKEFIKGSITPEDDQSLYQVPGYLTEAQMWMGMQTKKMRSQYR